MQMTQDLKKDFLISAGKYFYDKGWVMGTSGNLSAKLDNETFLITISGKDKGSLTPEDFLELSLTEPYTPNPKSPLKPSAETLLHSSIYKNTDAEAIFHVHTTNITVLSQAAIRNPKSNLLQFAGLEMLKGFGFKTHDVTINIPVIENNQDMKYLAEVAPKYINETIPGLALSGHGIYAWGKTLEEAKRHIEIFESLFDYRVMELSISTALQ